MVLEATPSLLALPLWKKRLDDRFGQKARLSSRYPHKVLEDVDALLATEMGPTPLWATFLDVVSAQQFMGTKKAATVAVVNILHRQAQAGFRNALESRIVASMTAGMPACFGGDSDDYKYSAAKVKVYTDWECASRLNHGLRRRSRTNFQR